MLRHVSIGVNNPAAVAAVLAEMWGGVSLPSPPDPGGFIVFADDEHGSCIEIYTKDRLVKPGPDDAHGGRAAVTPRYSPTHVNLSAARSREEILAIAGRAGWPAKLVERAQGYKLVNVWIEGELLLEVVSEADLDAYRTTHNSAAWRERLLSVA